MGRLAIPWLLAAAIVLGPCAGPLLAASDPEAFHSYPSWSPDGRRILFTSDRTGDFEIWLYEMEADRMIRLTRDPGRDTHPAFSPDGRHIAFVSDRAGTADLWMMNADGTGVTALTRSSEPAGYPVFSPDGRSLLFYQGSGSGETVFTLDIDTLKISPWPGLKKGPNHSAVWIPGGRGIVFESRRDGNLEIYAQPSPEERPRNLTRNPAQDYLPAVSPDGTRVAFHTDRDGDHEIYLMGIDGSDPVNLTRNPASDMVPRWSPDGRELVFISDRSGEWMIWFMKPDGTGARPMITE